VQELDQVALRRRRGVVLGGDGGGEVFLRGRQPGQNAAQLGLSLLFRSSGGRLWL
jgi:hypothetical protein